MADLQDAAVAARRCRPGGRADGQSRPRSAFPPARRCRFQQRASDVGVRGGGHGDDGGVDVAAELVEWFECLAAVFRGGSCGALRIEIDDADQLSRRAT